MKKNVIRVLTLTAVFLLTFLTVAAAGESQAPVAAIEKFSELFFAAIQAVGLIMVGYGAIQIGISLKNQDASQRSQAVLALMGGLFIVFAKVIVDYLVA